MESEARSAEQLRLEEVRRDIDQWRQTRAKAGAMPEELWERATSVARIVGLYPTTRALRLNYGALKQRLAPLARRGHPRTRIGEPAPKPSRGNFVEVRGVPLLGGLSNDATVVEMVGIDGARLTIRLKGTSPDVVGLVNAFRERR